MSFLDGLRKGFSRGKNPPLHPGCQPSDCCGDPPSHLAGAAPEVESDYQPKREDGFEAWLKNKRGEYPVGTEDWNTLDYLLDQYRLLADTRTPLDEHVCEPHCDCEFEPTPLPDYLTHTAEGLVMRENPDEPPAGSHRCADSPYYDHLPQDCQAQPENDSDRVENRGVFHKCTRSPCPHYDHLPEA